jgi:hypothetical protein
VLSPQWMLAGKAGPGGSAAPREGGGAGVRGVGAPAERWSKPIAEAGARQRPEEARAGGRTWREDDERELAPGESRLLSRPAGAGPPRGVPQQGSWKDPGAGFPAPPPQPPARFTGKDDFRGAPPRGWDAQGPPVKPEVRRLCAPANPAHPARRRCALCVRATAARAPPAVPSTLAASARAAAARDAARARLLRRR